MTWHAFSFASRGGPLPGHENRLVPVAPPCGLLHPATEVGHLDRGRIALTVNGELRQQADLTDLIWSVPEIIAHLSSLWRIETGDLIYTGTPAGVGPVVEGDALNLEIDGLSPLRITIGAPAA
ncbi:MAG TPA: fumarylacetoacetate hydrolase family protein [Sphingomonas sp.]|nr:fumarylacetoacetate hydrolase family protein [Sphingomonas sp.]